MSKLHLQVVSQEKELINQDASMVSVITSDGEITILPNHVPLFTKLKEGVMRYQHDGVESAVVLSEGFLTVDPTNDVTIMVDSAVMARELTERKAQEAVQAAEEALKTASNRREQILAEASHRMAMLELKLTRKSRKPTN